MAHKTLRELLGTVITLGYNDGANVTAECIACGHEQNCPLDETMYQCDGCGVTHWHDDDEDGFDRDGNVTITDHR